MSDVWFQQAWANTHFLKRKDSPEVEILYFFFMILRIESERRTMSQVSPKLSWVGGCGRAGPREDADRWGTFAGSSHFDRAVPVPWLLFPHRCPFPSDLLEGHEWGGAELLCQRVTTTWIRNHGCLPPSNNSLNHHGEDKEVGCEAGKSWRKPFHLETQAERNDQLPSQELSLFLIV